MQSALLISSALLLGGCGILSSEPYRETAIYDISGGKAKQLPAFAVRIDGFNNLTPANRKMIFRQTDGRLLEAPYTAWAQAPEQMLRRYLSEYFARDYMTSTRAGCDISGSIFQFDFDYQRKKMLLGVNYEINYRTGNNTPQVYTGTFVAEAAAESADGPGAAAALSACAAEFAAEIEAKLLTIK
ncbi:MAG: ABC-type transport auxiliary lipoprotein family protein [Victivallaceae bacterium]